MADKTIEVKVTESGLAEVKRKAEAVNKELDKVEQPRVVKSATRTGSRAADAALSVSGGPDAGLRRGTTGAGGRGGERDFARQAQGLGGLVHLYATFAANIYAVGAAFTALQKAADFERMEQSASRMSSVLGINLKAAANNMVLLTDGAVSFTDAIEKTNLAASAGLSTKQIDSLTKVAKGASTALGRDMGDSLNRLVKGTVKLEPELLDELGILTKASEAYAAYAMGIGKSADELTKFEKTQAFVNAVIAEGDSKFSSLYTTVEANPYTKLQASIENLGKSSLGILNNVISPIIKFLSESPTGLAAAIGLVVGKLAKLAMPELLAGLATRVERATNALDVASLKFKSANEAVFKSFEQTVGYATISSNSKSKILKEATALRKQLNDSILTDFELTKPGQQVKYSDSTTKLIDDYEKKLTGYKNRLEGRSGELSPRSARDLGAVKQELSLLQDMKQSYAKLADNEQIAATDRKKENRATLELLKAQKAMRVTELVLDGEHIAALKASYNLEAQITREKLTQLGIEGKGRIGKTALKIGGAIGGAIGVAETAVMSIATKLGTIGAAIALVSAAYEGLKWVFGEAKSINDFTAAVDASQDASKIFSERILKLNMLMQAGTNDTAAYSRAQHLAGTSLNESADSINNIYDNYRKVQAEITGGALWTRGMDFISSLFNKDTLTTGAQGMASTIVESLSTATALGNTQLSKSLASALRIDVKDVDNISIVTAKLKELVATGNSYAIFNVQKALQDAGREALNAESRIASVTEALKSANKEAEGVGAKRELKNPKYEELLNTVSMINKVTNESEKSMLLTNLFGGMSDRLIAELSIVSSELKNFFNSSEFKQYKISQAFDLSEVGANFKRLLNDMKNDAFLFFTDVKNMTKTSGTGWMEMGTPGVGTTNFEEFKSKAQIQLDKAEAQKLNILDNLDAMVADYSKSLSRPLTEEETAIAKQAIADSATNQVNALKTFLADLEIISNTTYSNNVDRIRAEIAAGDKFKKAGGGELPKPGDIGKVLERAVPALPTKGKAGSIPTYPKDRLQTQKSKNELLQIELKLQESVLGLIDEELKLAGDTLGMYGSQYDQLILNKNAQMQSVFDAKKAQQEYELNLKRLERIESIKADKNVKDKDKEIKYIDDIFKDQKKALDNTLAAEQKRINVQKELNLLKTDEVKLAFASSLVGAAQAGKPLAENMAMYSKASEYAQIEAEALLSQLASQKILTAKYAAIADKNGLTAEMSKIILDSKKSELDIANKLYEVAKANNELNLKTFELTGKGGLTEYLTNAANQFGYVFREQLKSSKGTMVTLVNGIVAGVNSSIDELFKQIQEGTANLQSLTTFASNALSNAFRDAAAQSVKDLISNTIGTLLDPTKKSLEATLTSTASSISNSNLTLQASLDSNRDAIIANTAALQGKTSTEFGSGTFNGTPKQIPGGGSFGDTSTSLTDDAINKTETAAQTQENAAKETSSAGKTFLKASDTMFLAGAAMMAFQGKWEQVAFMFLAQLATTLTTMAVTSGSSGGGIWGSLFKAGASLFGSTTASANGNIMSPYGPLKLNKYSTGGIATSPQLSLFGEGSRNEAYVPLPDNRTIPVTLSGNTGGQVNIGDTTINVSVDSSGNSQTSVEGNAQMAKMLGQAIKKTVHEEFINQARPGGILYGR